MPTTIRVHTKVLPGRRIVVNTPELPEDSDVDLVIMPSTPDETGADGRYPASLNAEYNALVDAQWERELTGSEAARLEEIKAEINAIDAASESANGWKRQIAAIHQQLAEIRREVEALPDAP